MEKPEGVWFDLTPDGFRLRASCRSFVDTVMRVGLAGVVSVLPFKLWWDLIRGFWSDQGFSFWATAVFLGVWAAAIVYTDWIALVSLFGEVRITKRSNEGEIFTGVWDVGRVRRFRWNSFRGIEGVEADLGGSQYHKARYLALSGPHRRLKFGWQLPDERRAYIAEVLRLHAGFSA